MSLRPVTRMLSLVPGLTLMLMLGGCLHDEFDVEYKYDVPTASNCPSGMQHRSGGTGIVDRSGGTGIVDRDGNSVTDFCYVPNCPGGYDDTIPPEMEWHQDTHGKVVATRTCVAIPVPPPGDGSGN